MFTVQEQHITNAEIRNRFYNISTIEKCIEIRQLKWVGKIASMDFTRMPRKILACWTQNPRKKGRPQFNIRNSYANALKKFVPGMTDKAELKYWIDKASGTDWNHHG